MSSEEFRSFSFAIDASYMKVIIIKVYFINDLLISDASSFRVSLPQQKPIIYLNREDVCGTLDDTIREEIYGSCYGELRNK